MKKKTIKAIITENEAMALFKMTRKRGLVIVDVEKGKTRSGISYIHFGSIYQQKMIQDKEALP